jgi:transposase
VGGWVDELNDAGAKARIPPTDPSQKWGKFKTRWSRNVLRIFFSVHRLLAFARSINTLMHAKIGLNRRASVGPDTVL